MFFITLHSGCLTDFQEAVRLVAKLSRDAEVLALNFRLNLGVFRVVDPKPILEHEIVRTKCTSGCLRCQVSEQRVTAIQLFAHGGETSG